MKSAFRSGLTQCVQVWILALLPAALTAVVHPRSPQWSADALGPGEVRLSDALTWGDGVLWLDARSRTAYETDRIPGAYLLNEDEWESLIGDIFLALQPGWSIVVYCDSRECQASKHVAERLRGEEYQFDNVYVLHGGWEVWQKANRSN